MFWHYVLWEDWTRGRKDCDQEVHWKWAIWASFIPKLSLSHTHTHKLISTKHYLCKTQTEMKKPLGILNVSSLLLAVWHTSESLCSMKNNLHRPAFCFVSSASFVSASNMSSASTIWGLLFATFVAVCHWTTLPICYSQSVGFGLWKGRENINKTLTRVLPIGSRLTKEKKLFLL